MAMQAGEVLFGENKAQELRDKFPLMQQYNRVEWHFIGLLQTNKVKDVDDGYFGANQYVLRGEQIHTSTNSGEKFPPCRNGVLSMGISGDFKVAIEEGATMIRVGTKVFGERYLPDSYYWNESASQDE